MAEDGFRSHLRTDALDLAGDVQGGDHSEDSYIRIGFFECTPHDIGNARLEVAILLHICCARSIDDARYDISNGQD